MTELIKNEKYEVKCSRADGEVVDITISIKSEKLSEEEVANLNMTIRKILFAFDRTDSVSSRYGSMAERKKGLD
jgi:hypothetical protein